MADTTMEQRLADHEARLHMLEEQRRADSLKLDHILDALARMETRFSVMHTPTDCPQRVTVDDHEVRLRMLEKTAEKLSGGSRVVMWMLGTSGAALLLGILSLVIAFHSR